ncbi:MAG: hypothetical protein KGO96_02025 [Elusimicrobia bacterium]|nr:hypothetical protein [Elusimicrobiota bacterium]MDE2238059.1 hypothetical protein [Elusimicrobiota bacterium]MDE2424673.1 hypothetical protein [Elusimicrobiota bacterium]
MTKALFAASLLLALATRAQDSSWRAVFAGDWRDGGPPAFMTINRPPDFFPKGFRPNGTEPLKRRLLVLPTAGTRALVCKLGFHGMRRVQPWENDDGDLEFALDFNPAPDVSYKARYFCKPPHRPGQDRRQLECLVEWTKYERDSSGRSLETGQVLERYLLNDR